MPSTRAAVRYAKAILEIAQAQSVALEVSQDMTLIANTINGNFELNTFIQNPTLKTIIKYNAISGVFSTANSVTKSLFQLLLENKRFEILEAIALEYKTLFDEVNGIEVADVTTAIAMDREIEEKVLVKIATLSNKKITIKNIIDPSIIGGFILRIGDNQFNASVANRLQVLKRELSN